MLSVAYAPQQLFAVNPPSVDFGELDERAEAVTRSFYCYSTTRPQSTLPVPAVRVSVPDPFLTVGEPVPMTDREFGRTGRPRQPRREIPLSASGRATACR